MLALVARNLRWVRSRANRFTTLEGRTGENFNTNIASWAVGETLTTVRFGYQITFTGPVEPAWPFNQQISLGIIEADTRLTAPPARPLDNPNADWLWIEPGVFNLASRQSDVSGVITQSVVAAGVAQRQVKAQRKGREPEGSDVWLSLEWQDPLPAGNFVHVRLTQWFSAGILEP